MKHHDCGDLVELRGIRKEQHFAEPPPRYSEASLVKTLEFHGIGRPSTYASIISTLQQREYVVMKNRRFVAADVGMVVAIAQGQAKWMSLCFVCFVSAMKFTRTETIKAGQRPALLGFVSSVIRSRPLRLHLRQVLSHLVQFDGTKRRLSSADKGTSVNKFLFANLDFLDE